MHRGISSRGRSCIACTLPPFSLLIFRYPAWRFRVQSVMLLLAHSPFSLLVFRHASRHFLAHSVMCYLHTPSLARYAACLTKNFRR